MISSALSASRRSARDRRFRRLLAIPAALAGIAVLGIAAFVIAEASPALRSIGLWAPLADAQWQPASGAFGMAPMLAATLVIALGALLLAAPLGVGAAAFARMWAPRPLARVLRGAQILLAGLPSVVFGAWGLVVVVPAVAAWQPPGASVLAATLVLALMILPTIALAADAAIAGVPGDLVQGAAALGLRRGAVLRHVVLPMARRGIGAGLVLALGRAVGETMAVLMVAGNVVQWPTSVFAPVRTLTANIALEMGYASEAHRSVLFVGGLLLLAMVAALTLVGHRRGRGIHA